MTVFWSIIAWAVMLPVLPIVYFMQKNECKPKKNIIVGVTLPYEAQGDAEVLALLERYGKELKRMCWAMLAAVVPGLFVRSLGLFITYYDLGGRNRRRTRGPVYPVQQGPAAAQGGPGVAADGGCAPGGRGPGRRCGGDAVALALVVRAALPYQPGPPVF